MTNHRLRVLLAVAVFASCTPPESSEVTPASAAALREATFAGRTDNPELFAAVLTTPGGVEAYLCDGTVDFWFRGAGTADSVLELENEAGAKLLLEVQGERLQGRLLEGDEKVTRFELPEVQGEVLFRDETAAGEERVLGGWIRLPDGAQRGVVRVGSTSFNSTITDGVVQCAACQGVVNLSPAPFTPSAAGRRPNVVQRFTVVALGDSYMSGEGAPVTLGNLTDNGSRGTQERWSDGLPDSDSFSFTLTDATRTRLAREARACHRGAAGIGLAVGELGFRWPGVSFIHQNLACSGALVRHALDTTYGGPGACASLSGTAQSDCLAISDDMPTASIQPQLPEALAFLRSQGLTLDALVMSIGGNDLAFGDIMADCLSSTGGGCEKPDSKAQRALTSGVAALPGEYDRLGAALAAANIPDSSVFLTQYPSPLRRNASDLCSGLEFDDALMRFFADEESVFAGQVHTTMNRLVREGAVRNGWKPITSHIGTEVGHSMCNPGEQWFNDTETALRTQGEDLVAPVGFVHISAGMVHPNQRGHREGYKPAYVAALDELLRKRFTPRLPTRFRVTKMALEGTRGRVTFTWDDVNAFETRHNLRTESGAFVEDTGPDTTSVEVLLDGTAGSFTVEACTVDPALCSPRSAVLDVEVKKPTHTPQSAFASVGLAPANDDLIIMGWKDAAPTRMYSTVELEIGTTVQKRAVEGQGLSLPIGTDLKRFRVAACNDLGCGPATAWTTFSRPATNVLPPCENPQLNGCRP